jgi:hypothetical protein
VVTMPTWSQKGSGYFRGCDTTSLEDVFEWHLQCIVKEQFNAIIYHLEIPRIKGNSSGNTMFKQNFLCESKRHIIKPLKRFER